jgi:hypothetical protein
MREPENFSDDESALNIAGDGSWHLQQLAEEGMVKGELAVHPEMTIPELAAHIAEITLLRQVGPGRIRRVLRLVMYHLDVSDYTAAELAEWQAEARRSTPSGPACHELRQAGADDRPALARARRRHRGHARDRDLAPLVPGRPGHRAGPWLAHGILAHPARRFPRVELPHRRHKHCFTVWLHTPEPRPPGGRPVHWEIDHDLHLAKLVSRHDW